MKYLFRLILIAMLLLNRPGDPLVVEPDLSKNEKLDKIDSELLSLYDNELFNASPALKGVIAEIRELVNLLKKDYPK